MNNSTGLQLNASPGSPNPLVSIIVPSYNQGRFIRKTINSIIEQDYRPLEIIVIDGASSDETVEVLHSCSGVPELTWISEPDSGVVEAVNKGFARAKGAICAIQSSDDYYLPGAVTAGVAALQADASLGFVFGDIVKVDDGGNELTRTSLRPYSLEDVLAVRTWIPQPSTFFRLSLAREAGGWREEVPYAADTDLWLRMAFRADARKLDRVMAGRTMHEAQRDRQGARIARDYGRMLDQLEPLQTASLTVRQAAAAGRLLIENRYLPGLGYWGRWLRLWRAVFLYPSLLEDLDRMALLPGWQPFRAWLAEVKQAICRPGGAA